MYGGLGDRHSFGLYDTSHYIAPVVAYLASERSDWCTGQTISARGYEVGLYNVPQVIRQIASPGPWDLDMLTRMIEHSFQPAVTGSGGPFRR